MFNLDQSAITCYNVNEKKAFYWNVKKNEQVIVIKWTTYALMASNCVRFENKSTMNKQNIESNCEKNGAFFLYKIETLKN